jgi:hypothetical protein
MATISIKDLNSLGSDLLLDKENYLDSLSEELYDSVTGGGTILASLITVVSPASPQVGGGVVATAIGSAALTYNITKTFGK